MHAGWVASELSPTGLHPAGFSLPVRTRLGTCPEQPGGGADKNQAPSRLVLGGASWAGGGRRGSQGRPS